eukprot:TRINITY_DN7876_c0_g4_i1.p1 TRINITY_DN7876_c0_g4~~TRINITY_DN7876_c0_g4_i1.p1  ORF type:complete len:258 (+),score=57.09 TRINITY_DN7876_c0_g4_i1:213-986(+)
MNIFLLVRLLFVGFIMGGCRSTKISIPTFGIPPCNGTVGCAWDDIFLVHERYDHVIGCTVISPDPYGGPGPAPDPRYVALVKRAAAANLPVVGILDPYSIEPFNLTLVLETIDKYYSFYPGLAGIFLYTFDNICEEIPIRYQVIWDHIHTKQDDPIVVINLGPLATECFMNVSTIILTYQYEIDNYMTYSPAPWMKNYPPERFWNTIANVPESKLETVVERAKELGVGHVFVTSYDMFDNYQHLPAYFDKEAQMVSN